ncbi:related to translation initiation factor IF-3 [Fusarium torulosum]|uniref:Related to translation initiation factor IF-3 n=1 Tax=Fusarium torulosum TaxID=33205 RepID=A0AAE8SLJ9_9HYPO|nr:related to translation initiation factor IF-3 [Fusarium torulosum]
MSSFACLQSSRRALYRVFVEHEALLTRQLLPITQRALPLYQNRFFSTSPFQLKARRENPRQQDQESEPFDDEDRSYDRRYTTKEEFEKSGRDRLPKDHEIKDPKIMVLDNGVFDGPLLTRNVLSRLADTESLRMVTPYIRADPKNNKEVQYAICKIVNKREEYERQRELHERRRVSKQTSSKTKELEMSWAISDHDLKIKTKQLVGFLEKGMKVEIVLGFKKKGQKKRTSEDTAEEVFAKVKKLVEDLGSREYKPKDGQVGRTMRIHLEGISKKKEPQKDAEAPVDQEMAPQEGTEAATKDANV